MIEESKALTIDPAVVHEEKVVSTVTTTRNGNQKRPPQALQTIPVEMFTPAGSSRIQPQNIMSPIKERTGERRPIIHKNGPQIR